MSEVIFAKSNILEDKSTEEASAFRRRIVNSSLGMWHEDNNKGDFLLIAQGGESEEALKAEMIASLKQSEFASDSSIGVREVDVIGAIMEALVQNRREGKYQEIEPLAAITYISGAQKFDLEVQINHQGRDLTYSNVALAKTVFSDMSAVDYFVTREGQILGGMQSADVFDDFGKRNPTLDVVYPQMGAAEYVFQVLTCADDKVVDYERKEALRNK